MIAGLNKNSKQMIANAWTEVVAQAGNKHNANTLGMYNQFGCHVVFAFCISVAIHPDLVSARDFSFDI